MSKSVWKTDCLAIVRRRAVWGERKGRERERGRVGRERSNVRGRRRRDRGRVGWACQLVDILNGKLPRPSLQPATTLEQTKVGVEGKRDEG